MAGLQIRIMGDEAIRERMAQAPDRITKAMRQAVGRSLDLIYRRAALNLTAGNPLHVRTGRLRQSVQTEVQSDTSGRIGTNVEYAAAQEFGFSGAEQVRPHQRRLTHAFGVRLRSPISVQVRGYSRQMNIPERPFLRPAARDSQSEIIDLFRKGLAAAIGAK